MSVLRQLNVLGQMRLDVPHIRSIESSIAADFDVVVGRGWAGDRGLVVRGFTLSNTLVGTTASEIQLLAADAIVYNVNASESGSFLWVPPDRPVELLNTSNPKVSGSFTASTVNYIGIDFKREADDSTTDLVQFLDANTLLENGRNIPLGRTLDYTILISSAPFSTTPNIVPIAKVTTDANNKIASIQDARTMMYRLGSGGDNPNAQFAYTFPFGRQENDVANKFTGGDKNILSNKDWMNALMTRVWELGGGENWYSPTHPKNIRVTRKAFPDVFSNGENFEQIGVHTHWRGLGVLFENANTPGIYFNEIADQLTDDVLTLQTQLNVGDCLYVDIDFTANRSGPTALQMRKAPLQSLGTPTVPGSRLVIAWRSNNTGSIDIYSRDYPYLINVTIEPATDTSVGGVRLNEPAAAGMASTPTVLTLGLNNVYRIDQAAYLPLGFNPALRVVGSAFAAIEGVGGPTGTTNGIHGISGPSSNGGYGVVGFGNGALGGGGVFGQGAGNGEGIGGLGSGSGRGGSAMGGTTAGTAGFKGQAQATGGNGVEGQGFGGGHGVFGLGGSNGIGVFGNGLGTGAGVWGQGDTAVSPSSAIGVHGDGGLPDGMGVRGFGKGTGNGGNFTALGTGRGVDGQGGSSSGTGVRGTGGAPSGRGVEGFGATDGSGVFGTGGPGSGTSGGIGVQGTGGLGDSGNLGGTGVHGQGGTGGADNGGDGVRGVGGAGDSGFSGGIGGRFTGGIGDTGQFGGQGVVGTGGTAASGFGGDGVSGTGGTSATGLSGAYGVRGQGSSDIAGGLPGGGGRFVGANSSGASILAGPGGSFLGGSASGSGGDGGYGVDATGGNGGSGDGGPGVRGQGGDGSIPGFGYGGIFTGGNASAGCIGIGGAGGGTGGYFEGTGTTSACRVPASQYFGHVGPVNKTIHLGVERFATDQLVNSLIAFEDRGGYIWQSATTGTESIFIDIPVPALATVTSVQILCQSIAAVAEDIHVFLTRQNYAAGGNYTQTAIDTGNPTVHQVPAGGALAWRGATTGTYTATAMPANIVGVSEGKLYMQVKMPQTALGGDIIIRAVRVQYSMTDFTPAI